MENLQLKNVAKPAAQQIFTLVESFLVPEVWTDVDKQQSSTFTNLFIRKLCLFPELNAMHFNKKGSKVMIAPFFSQSFQVNFQIKSVYQSPF